MFGAMKLRGWALLIGSVMAAAATTGCSVATSSVHDASAVGGTVVGSIAVPPPAAAQLPPPPPATMGAFLDGPVGMKLGDADRQKAFQAEQDALAANDRKTWRGDQGHFGFVTLSGTPTADGCQDFAHTIYIAGRPQSGKGTGCKGPDGTWRIAG